MDKRILETVILKFGGGPVGVNSLAVAVGATTALRIPAARFMKLLNAHGTIATAVLRMVTSRIRTALAARGTESG